MSSQVMSCQVKSCQVMSRQVKASQGKSSQVKASQGKSRQVKASQVHIHPIHIHQGPDLKKCRIFDFFQNRPSITGIDSQTIDSLFSRLNDLKKYRFFKISKIRFVISKNIQNSHINHTGKMDILKNGILEKSQKSQKRPLSGNPAFWLQNRAVHHLCQDSRYRAVH